MSRGRAIVFTCLLVASASELALPSSATGQAAAAGPPAATMLFGPPPDTKDKREARPYRDWVNASQSEYSKNNRETYERIVKRYPGTDGARKAQWWLDDDKAAFLVSCDIGTRQALRGFREAHATSQLVPLAEAYGVWLAETDWHHVTLLRDNMQENTGIPNAVVQKFIAKHPDNAFGPGALANTPVSWLKGVDARVGVEIKVGELVSKGVLGGTSNRQKIRNKLWEIFGEALVRGGVNAKLVEPPPAPPVADLTHEMIIMYREESSPQRTTGSSLMDGAAANLMGALFSRANQIVNCYIRATGAGVEPIIFSSFVSVDDVTPIAMVSALTELKMSGETRVAALILSRAYKRDEAGSMKVLAEYLQASQAK